MPRKSKLSAFLTLALGLIALFPVAGAFAYSFATPERGSFERIEIMNALRKPVQELLGQRVIFIIDTLKVGEGWAFINGRPRKPSGEKLDFSKTKYATAIADGVFEDSISALLYDDGDGWKVLSFEIGATDVPWAAWPEEFNAPAELFEP